MSAVVMEFHCLRNGKKHQRCWRGPGRTVLVLVLQRLDYAGNQVAKVEVLGDCHQFAQSRHVRSHGLDFGDRADGLFVVAHGHIKEA